MTQVMEEWKAWETYRVRLGSSEQSGWVKVKKVELEKEDLVRDTPEKITCNQIQGSQVEKLELYFVDIKDLGQRSDMITSVL